MPFRSPKPPPAPSSEAAVRVVALRLLTVRARGAEDLSRTLERRGFDRAAVQSAIARLVREGWLDDLSAARSLVRARGSRYGKARIARELSALGFPKEVAAAALGESGEVEEKALARAFGTLWRRAAVHEPSARRRRVRAALARRGFAPGAISAMMKGSHDDEDMDIG
jgi:SOS response regulatory protein OraA/RecX